MPAGFPKMQWASGLAPDASRASAKKRWFQLLELELNDDFETVTENVAPWANLPDVVGQTGTATTRLGRKLSVWRPGDSVKNESHRYWCHGHSFGTYKDFGFSPFSGPDVEILLKDEWQRIDKKPAVGDVLVFRASAAGKDHGEAAILHTARIVSATYHFGGRTEIVLSSKNGSDRLLPNVSPARVLSTYRNCYWFKTTDKGSTRVDKQYYRRLP
jgi:hypothetical protein